jgi:cytoskeletal protein RodZ
MGAGNLPPSDEPGGFDETVANPAVGGEPTQLIPRVGPAGPTGSAGGPPPGGPPPPYGPGPGAGDNRRRNLLLIVAGVFVLGIAIGALVVWLGHDDSKSSTSPTTDSSSTSSSSSSSSSSTSSTSENTTSPTQPPPPPTQPPAVQINNFQASSARPNCSSPAPAPGVSTSVTATVQQVTLTWSTQNATSVDISVDGPGVYQSNVGGSSITIPYGCPGPHEYLLTAHGPNGTATTRSVSVSSS